MKLQTFQLGDLVRTISYRGHQTNQSGFRESGKFPIIDQGQTEIAGFTDDVPPITSDLPIVIFGDHTRLVKYASSPFVVGADGVKLIKSVHPEISDRLLYWLIAAVAARIPSVGYGRHFTGLCDLSVTVDARPERRLLLVDALDKCEAAMKTADAIIAAKREQKRGLMQQLLTGKVRFPGFTEPWRMVHLGDFVELDRGVSYARETDLRAPGSAGCVRLLRATNVQDGQIVLSDVHHIDARRSSSSDLLTAGDLIICIANGSKHLVGKHAIATSEVCIEPTVVGAFCARARPRARVRPAFVAALMESHAYRRWIGALLAGTNINNLKPNDIASAPLRVPTSWPEIERITRTYEVANREIRILETQREAFATQRRGLMERLLSGEIDIPSSDTSAA